MLKNVSNFISINKARIFIGFAVNIKISTCFRNRWEHSYHLHLYAESVNSSLCNLNQMKIEQSYPAWVEKITYIKSYFICMMIIHPENCYHGNYIKTYDRMLNAEPNLCLHVSDIKDGNEKWMKFHNHYDDYNTCDAACNSNMHRRSEKIMKSRNNDELISDMSSWTKLNILSRSLTHFTRWILKYLVTNTSRALLSSWLRIFRLIMRKTWIATIKECQHGTINMPTFMT